MYYLIGRDLDGDGEYEFIRDLEHMILTEDPDRAMQLTERDLDSIDMAYLAEAGFYALEADRFQVSLLEQLLFHPLVRGFRPLVPPPPRRPRVHRAPPPPPRPRVARVAPPPPRPAAPKPRPAAAAPRPRLDGHGMGRSGAPARGPEGGRGPGGRGPGGPGGRGPGR
ncbi:MAG: hypothetical protein Q4G06_10265 [Clostridia bacterium]|nr:hypothetical protein [Clostridia bacterium]